jgi:hypothetical protein
MPASESRRRWLNRWFEGWTGTRPARPRRLLRDVEGLEDRTVPASVAPGTYTGFLTANTEFDQAGTYTITGTLTVNAGVTLTVTGGATVLVKQGANVVVNGNLAVNAPVAFRAEDLSGSSTTGIRVATGGTFAATNAAFGEVVGGNEASTTRIQVDAGGAFAAAGSTFGWDQTTLNNSSTVNPGGVTTSAFDGELALPPRFVPILAAGNNLRFRDVVLNNGTTTSPTLTLAPMGADTTNLWYVFPAGTFTVAAGTSLAVAANARVYLYQGAAVAVAGAMTVAGPAELRAEDFAGSATVTGVEVLSGGSLAVTNAVFSENVGTNPTSTTRVLVRAGGAFAAAGTTFGWDRVELSNNSTLNPVTDTAFDGVLAVQARFVPALAAGNNRRFQDVEINPGTTTDPALTLGVMGAVTTDLRYVFPVGTFTVAAGTTLTTTGARVLLRSGAVIAAGGILTVNAPAAFTAEDVTGSATVTGVEVLSGGSLAVTNAVFDEAVSGTANSTTRVLVRAGGTFAAARSTFGWDRVDLSNNSTLNPVTESAFDGVLGVQAKFVPVLAAGANRRFGDIEINPGTTTDPSLTLDPMGEDGSNFRYVFPDDFTVAAGTTLTTTGARVLLRSGAVITASGVLSVNAPAAFEAEDPTGFGTITGIDVPSGGALVTTNAVFGDIAGGTANSTTRILIGNGGQLIARKSSFGWDQLTLAAGSLPDMQGNFLNTNFAVNSGAVLTGNPVRNNDFSPISSPLAVVASGTTGTSIDLTNNYWGTVVTSVIDAKITDQKDSAALPVVNYLPVLADRPTLTQGVPPAPISFNPGGGTPVSLNAYVTSPGAGGPVNVNGGTITFTILSGVTVIATSAAVPVFGGVASTGVTIPAGTPGGTYTVRVNFSGTTGFSPTVDATQILVIQPIAQTISFTPPASVTYTAGQTVNLPATSTSGLAITYTLTGGTGLGSISGNVLTVTQAGTFVIRAAQPGNSSYTAATSVSQTLTVNKADQTVAFTPPAGGTFAPGLTINLLGTATATSGLGVTYRVVAGGTGAGTISGTTLTVTQAGTIFVAADQAGNANFNAASSQQTITVARANQSIPALPTTAVFAPGGTITLPAATAAGLTVAYTLVSGPATLAGNVLTVTGAGTIQVQAAQAGNANYNPATTVNASITVSQAAQTIAFPAVSPATFAPGLQITLSATGGASGNPVTFTVVSGPGTVSGTTLTVTGAGSIVVRADQAGTADYSTAAAVQRTVTVGQAGQSISFTQPGNATFAAGLTIPLTATGGASGSAVTFTITGGTGAGTVTGSTLTVTRAGTFDVRADQAGDANYTAAAAVSRSFTVGKADQAVAFNPTGVAPFAAGLTIPLSASGGGSGNPVTFSVVSGPGTVSGATLTVTGTGDIVVRADQAGDANYNAASAQRSINVVPTLTFAGGKLAEFREAGTAAGTLGGTGAGTLTFTLVPGVGADDNAAFRVAGNLLVSADVFEFAVKSSYSVRVRLTDGSGNTAELPYLIAVLDDPAVARSGRTLAVAGGAGADDFVFAADPVAHGVVLNGVLRRVRAADVDLVTFDGGGGSDTAVLYGRGANNVATLAPTAGTLSGPGFKVQTTRVGIMGVVAGGAGGTATLAGTAGKDTLGAAPTFATLAGANYSNTVAGFASVGATSNGGVDDVAFLAGSDGADALAATPTTATLTGAGFNNTAAGFRTVVAFGNGGADTGNVTGSAGADNFLATPTYAEMTGGGFATYLTGFEGVVAAGGGGTDAAFLADSNQADTITASGNRATLTLPTVTVVVDGFVGVIAYGTNGGVNRKQVGAVGFSLELPGVWVG